MPLRILTQVQDPKVGPFTSAFTMTNEQQEKVEQDDKELMGLPQNTVFDSRNSHILRYPSD